MIDIGKTIVCICTLGFISFGIYLWLDLQAPLPPHENEVESMIRQSSQGLDGSKVLQSRDFPIGNEERILEQVDRKVMFQDAEEYNWNHFSYRSKLHNVMTMVRSIIANQLTLQVQEFVIIMVRFVIITAILNLTAKLEITKAIS